MSIDVMIGIGVGLFAGAFLGVLITCCCVAAGEADREMQALCESETTAPVGEGSEA